MDKNKSLILYEGNKQISDLINDHSHTEIYNPGEFSIQLLKDTFQDIFYNKPGEVRRDRWKDMDWTPIHYEWDEDGVHYSEWKIGPMHTNDAGYEQFNEDVKNDLGMEQQNKELYYTPSIEELCENFIYESREYAEELDEYTDRWIKINFDSRSGLGHDETCKFDEDQVRVKYLDKEDIESLNWKYKKNDYSINNGCLDLMDYIWFEKPNYYLIFNPELMLVSLFILDVTKLEDCQHYPQIQNFPIKNKSELKQWMTKLNIS